MTDGIVASGSANNVSVTANFAGYLAVDLSLADDTPPAAA